MLLALRISFRAIALPTLAQILTSWIGVILLLGIYPRVITSLILGVDQVKGGGPAFGFRTMWRLGGARSAIVFRIALLVLLLGALLGVLSALLRVQGMIGDGSGLNVFDLLGPTLMLYWGVVFAGGVLGAGGSGLLNLVLAAAVLDNRMLQVRGKSC